MANFYKTLFRKVRHHLKSSIFREEQAGKDTPALKRMRESYSGFGGTVKLGYDLVDTIFKRITGKK